MKIIKRLLAKRRADRHGEIVHMACELFQIAEYCGQLWLTYNGNKVCPCIMLNDSPVEAVTKMRELYIRNHFPLLNEEKLRDEE